MIIFWNNSLPWRCRDITFKYLSTGKEPNFEYTDIDHPTFPFTGGLHLSDEDRVSSDLLLNLPLKLLHFTNE